MNQKGTSIDTSTHIPLTTVVSGNTCKLVGVSETRGGMRQRGRHRGWFQRLGRHHSHFEDYKRKWHDQSRRQITKRLLDLGLTKGCTFKVIQSLGGGPVLIEVRGTRIALGHGLARQVIVEVMEEKI